MRGGCNPAPNYYQRLVGSYDSTLKSRYRRRFWLTTYISLEVKCERTGFGRVLPCLRIDPAHTAVITDPQYQEP